MGKKFTERQKLLFWLRSFVDKNLTRSLQNTIAYGELRNSVFYPHYEIKNEQSLAILRSMKFIAHNEIKVDRAKADTLKVLLQLPSKL